MQGSVDLDLYFNWQFLELLELDKNKTISLAENGQVILTIFAGNDLRNLAEEKTTKLVKYMQKDFTQDYFKKYKEYF